MTEQNTWTEDDHYLASDVWGIEKAMETMTPEEELKAWRTTSGMLNHLCAMADALMLEPLILAQADALGRAREEERRAEDRISRPEGAELGPREEERLRAMLRRSDAFNNAIGAVVAEEGVREGGRQGGPRGVHALPRRGRPARPGKEERSHASLAVEKPTGPGSFGVPALL
jgi:hypothetical protein